MLKRLASASVLVVLVSALASGANAFTHDKRTYFTFNKPVALPGMTLPAGTYMFRIANPDTGRKVIQVANKEGTQSFAMLHTIPAQRPDAPKDSEIRFRETAAGAPPAVGTYWYMGERIGYEFLYSKAQLAALNNVAQPAAESVDSSADVPPIANPDVSTDVVEGPGLPDVDEPAAAEAQSAQVQPREPAAPPAPASEPAQAPARDELPRTASPLALLLLGGIATAGFGVKLLRKS